MGNDKKVNKGNKIKKIFARFIENVDKKMREKASSQCCCGSDKNNKSGGKSCCG